MMGRRADMLLWLAEVRFFTVIGSIAGAFLIVIGLR
jgi:hypothetical protein